MLNKRFEAVFSHAGISLPRAMLEERAKKAGMLDIYFTASVRECSNELYTWLVASSPQEVRAKATSLAAELTSAEDTTKLVRTLDWYNRHGQLSAVPGSFGEVVSTYEVIRHPKKNGYTVRRVKDDHYVDNLCHQGAVELSGLVANANNLCFVEYARLQSSVYEWKPLSASAEPTETGNDGKPEMPIVSGTALQANVDYSSSYTGGGGRIVVSVPSGSLLSSYYAPTSEVTVAPGTLDAGNQSTSSRRRYWQVLGDSEASQPFLVTLRKLLTTPVLWVGRSLLAFAAGTVEAMFTKNKSKQERS